MTEEAKAEKTARQLCLAAGKNPDKTIRFAMPLTLDGNGCNIIRVLMLPAWREHMREARRMLGEFA
jgi:hypothetical protein